MTSRIKYCPYALLKNICFLMIAGGLFTGQILAYPQGTNPHSQFLGGPYELMVKLGMQGSEMLFPVVVNDESVPGTLDAVLPVMGSSAKIRLEQFLPELVWEEYTEKSDKGGSVVKLRAVGPDLDQVIWLCAEDISRQSIASIIGGIGIKKVRGNVDIKSIAAQLAVPDAIGVLSVWDKDPNEPKTYVVSRDSEVQVDDSPYQFKILEYMPHYSVDTETRAITNASPEPKNPAVRVKFSGGEEPVEQWLHSRFPSHPHVANKIPLRVEFTDFDLGTQPSNYLILVADKGDPQMLQLRDGSRHTEKMNLQSSYPLAREGYSFVIDEVYSDVVLKRRWKNNRQQLLNPAIIAAVERDGQKSEVVLELNKPEHVRSDSETMVLLYRRKVVPVEHLE